MSVSSFCIVFSMCLILGVTTYSQTRTPNAVTLTRQQLTAISSLEKIGDEYRIGLEEERFQDVPAHVKIVASSILVLWDYRPSIEKQRLQKLTRYLIGSYVENYAEKKQSRVYLKRSVRHTIAEMAKRDKVEAQKLLQEFFEAEQGLLSEMDDDEKLELAEDLLDIDVSKSLNIANTVFSRVLPLRTISYLSKLKEVSAASHNTILAKINALLSVGIVYSIKDELILQSYIFKETPIAFPVADTIDVPGMDKLDFPVGGIENIEKEIFRGQRTDPDETRAYMSASISGIRRKTSLVSGGLVAAQIYFLVSKLQAYKDLHSEYLQLFTAPISSLSQDITAIALSNRVSSENIEHLNFMAKSVVLGHFGNSVSDIADDGVDDSTDSDTKIRVLENNILRAIARKEFSEAEKLIFEIKDIKTSRALIDFLHYSVIADGRKATRSITEIDERLSKISDLNVKLVAIFEVAESLREENNKAAASEYLFTARQIIFDRLANREKPQMFITLLILQSKIDKKIDEQLLSETVRSLAKNNTDKSLPPTHSDIYPIIYRGDSLSLFSRNVVDGGIRYSFPESNIESSFKSVANIDWEVALNSAELIENRFLRDRAVLTVASQAFLPRLRN